jgi:hypothetical protein
MANKGGFVGVCFTDAVAPLGEQDGTDIEVKNGYPLESGRKGTPGRLDEVTLVSVSKAPGMGDVASTTEGGFIGPGTQALKGIFGRKG